jgi:LPXTG-motif cell wall-anchored protein
MPQTGMDLWVIMGVLIAGFAAWLAWRQFRAIASRRTVNKIGHGSHNTQTGGQGQTENVIERGDHNKQGGA